MFIYLGITLFVALFGGIYEIFSNNVFSADMVFAWVYPLVLGVFMYLFMRFLPTDKVPGIVPASIYAFGVGIATLRSIFLGVINIYGTTNKAMVATYNVLTLVFVILGVVLYLLILGYYFLKKNKII